MCMDLIPEEKGEYFGEELGMYHMMFKVGILLTLLGFALVLGGMMLFPQTVLSLIGMLAVFIGLMVLFSGYLGIKDEEKKKGKKRIYTSYGSVSLYIGGTAGIAIFWPWFSIPLGAVAIFLGKKGLDKGDNTYASAGLLGGIIGIVGGAIVWSLFLFSGVG